MNAHIIANYNISEVLVIVKQQGEELHELSNKILSNPSDVMQVAAAEERGQHIARPIIDQGQLVRLYARALSF